MHFCPVKKLYFHSWNGARGWWVASTSNHENASTSKTRLVADGKFNYRAIDFENAHEFLPEFTKTWPLIKLDPFTTTVTKYHLQPKQCNKHCMVASLTLALVFQCMLDFREETLPQEQ